MKRRALRKDQIAALDSLASDPRNTLIVASGRAREEIEATFSSLSRAVGLAAEHGYYLRPPVKKGQLGGGERLTPLRSPARPGADSSAGLAAPQPEGEGEGEGEAVAQSGMSEGLTGGWEVCTTGLDDSIGLDDSWIDVCVSIMQQYVKRTQGTLIEKKKSSVTWCEAKRGLLC